jgi:quinol monooxygenase YgiN
MVRVKMNALTEGKECCVAFELWRQDDNGNRFLIGVFTDRACVERRLAELMRNPHKQTYWITEILLPSCSDEGSLVTVSGYY